MRFLGGFVYIKGKYNLFRKTDTKICESYNHCADIDANLTKTRKKPRAHNNVVGTM